MLFTLRRASSATWPTPPPSTIFPRESANPRASSAVIGDGTSSASGVVTTSSSAGPSWAKTACAASRSSPGLVTAPGEETGADGDRGEIYLGVVGLERRVAGHHHLQPDHPEAGDVDGEQLAEQHGRPAIAGQGNHLTARVCDLGAHRHGRALAIEPCTNEPSITASATLFGGARSGTRHGISPGRVIMVWVGSSLDNWPGSCPRERVATQRSCSTSRAGKLPLTTLPFPVQHRSPLRARSHRLSGYRRLLSHRSRSVYICLAYDKKAVMSFAITRLPACVNSGIPGFEGRRHMTVTAGGCQIQPLLCRATGGASAGSKAAENR